MPYNYNSNLWPNETDSFFKHVWPKPKRQGGPHCVSTSLAILTDQSPEYFQSIINTQDPTSWSDALHDFDMKLAYCPTDARKTLHYMNELVDLDDLFLLCYYTPTCPQVILQEPNENGWVCGSHVVVWHRDRIYDPLTGDESSPLHHDSKERFTKRIFRVVPSDFSRGL